MLRAHTRSRGLGAAAGGPSLWDYSLTAGTLPPVLSVARASTATRVNAAGLIVIEAANTARFDFNPVTFACLGLLLEPQRTNKIANSGGGETWSGSNATYTQVIASTPYGSASAMRITENTSNTIHYANPGSSGSSVIGKRYAASIYGKAESRGLISIRGLGLSTNGVIGSVSTGYVESTGSNTFPVYGASLRADGWGRIYGIGTATATSIALFGMAAATGGTASYQGDGVSSILMWGAQQEEIPAGSPDCPTSLIPTAASAVTRDADVLTLLDTSRSVEITYLPLAGGAAQIVQVAAGAQPSSIYGWVTRVRQL